MVSIPFLAVGFFMNLVAVFFVFSCIALILIILIQKGRGGGLSSAFGGGGAGGVLGSKTGDFLTWVTIGLVGVYLLFAIVMGKFYRPSGDEFGASATPQASEQAPAEIDVAGSNTVAPEAAPATEGDPSGEVVVPAADSAAGGEPNTGQ
jgi:preprotein translocase subunit SecG